MTQRTLRFLLASLFLFGSFAASFAAEEKPAEKNAPPAAAAKGASAPPSAEEVHAKQVISFLAADEREGRGPGTAGINQAAEYIANEFKQAGLKTDVFAGQPYQTFTMSVGSELGKRNSLALVGPPGPDGKPRRIELKLGEDYTPLSLGGSGKINVPLVFVGYGITARETSQKDPHADPHANPHGDPHAAPKSNPHGKAPEKKDGVKAEPAKTPAKPIAGSDPHAPPVKDGATNKPAAPAKADPHAAAKPAANPHGADPHAPALETKMLYDDYAGIDVKGKCVVVFRHQPQQGNPHGILPGIPNSPHAPFTRKISNAFEHGAAAVIFVTTEHDIDGKITARRKQWQESVDEIAEEQKKFAAIKNPTAAQSAEFRKKIDQAAQQVLEQSKKLEAERDPLLGFQSAGGSADGSRLPAMHSRRKVWDTVLAEAKQPSLSKLEDKIDEGPKPRSFALEGWSIEGEVDVEKKEAEVKNVVGVLEGDGPNADETIVIGAHYDHLGFGGEGSFVPTLKEIHNGADDNASGTTALIEAARMLGAGKKPGRRIVFIAFTAEERGLIGSARYCKDPLFPLDKTVAMLNMDMVGRLTDEKLIIQGGDTAKEFKPLLDKLNADTFKFKLTHNPGGFGPSDHASFYAKKIPVLHFFTGLHKDYHRPSDDIDKVNAAGLVRVAKMVADTATQIADSSARPSYLESTAGASGGGDRGGDRPYFGSIPDFSQTEAGYGISGVAKGSPSEKAGLKGGDVIIKLGESKVGNLDDFDSALRKFKGGDKVKVTVKRDGKELTLDITLGAPR